MKSKIWSWLVVFVAIAAILWIASAMTDPEEGAQLDFSSLAWLVFSLLAFAAIYVVYFMTRDSEAWVVGTRQVVMMAIGAALYGIFAWLFNASVIVVPSVSLVSIRPGIAIPVFFGFAFGPVVGFFTGAVGNILGDFLSGWGVYPVWDVGNGLIGLVAGFVMLFPDKKKSTNFLTWLIVALIALAVGFIVIEPEVPVWGEMTDQSGFIWVMIIAGVFAILARFFGERLGADTAAINLWGALGIIVGIGFAAFADIWINGYTFLVAMVGEFVPAAGPNIINAAILAPILLLAYNAVTARTGR